MYKIKIKPELLSLLTSEKVETFTSLELQSAYSQLPSSSGCSKKQVQQFIQRNLDRLEWAGFVVKKQDKKNLLPIYELTESFHPDNYSIGSPHCKVTETNVIASNPVDDNHLSDLIALLKKHKLELLTTISEAEEYEVLSKQLPNRREDIQDLYNDARNRSSSILGQVKAIESLIARSQAL